MASAAFKLAGAAPIRQQISKLTPPLENLFRHVLTIPGLKNSAYIDDVWDLLDEITAADLAKVCEDYDENLKDRIEGELADFEIALPNDNYGFLIEMLGEGKIVMPEDGGLPLKKKK